uniref:Uncharacterized protein n=1 Tax=Lactuca sativa TaxID=4236 RepID=A0A9R1WS01_LACSA|nr:hypothetical protein LSAT_V11C900464310 [Lactuca sativa]
MGFRSYLDCYVAITITNPPCNDFRKLRVTNVTPLMVHKHQEQEDEEEKRKRLPKTCGTLEESFSTFLRHKGSIYSEAIRVRTLSFSIKIHQQLEKQDQCRKIKKSSIKKGKKKESPIKKDKKKPGVKEFYSMKNRCSPESLLSIILGLSKEQKQCVRSMGFGALLKMKITNIPLKLGFYALQKFDYKRMMIDIEGKKLKVTTEFVHDMLGIPIGGTILTKLDQWPKDDTSYDEWKQQF